ncbi:hypothetical protein WKW79_15015 [Variovorax robiniae]|uniref:DUF4148 domain-containing protein n=1 Tax=Variovorax robiniae TaxID=1836199 RepID=A0ABU8X8D8_9BURK
MNRTLKINLVAAALLAGATSAMAGNYAEGDPRPVARTSTTSSAQVAADTQRWMQTAPTQGYPEGDPRTQTVTSTISRAAVLADTMLWVRSGLAAAQNGEAGADTSRQAYRQAQERYARMRSGPEYEALVKQIERARGPA